MFKVVVDYNTKEDELEIARKAAAQTFETISSVITKDEINTISEDIKKVHMDKEVEEYIVSIVHASREPQKYGLEEIKDYIFFGASPRATIDMFKASKAYAYIKGKSYVTPVDIAMIAKDILRHRIILSYEAQANSITTDFIISKILEKVDIP
jgi:MoxR-like ATPase